MVEEHSAPFPHFRNSITSNCQKGQTFQLIVSTKMAQGLYKFHSLVFFSSYPNFFPLATSFARPSLPLGATGPGNARVVGAREARLWELLTTASLPPAWMKGEGREGEER